MFGFPKRVVRSRVRGVRFSDEEIEMLKELQGKKTFGQYVRKLIYKDWKKKCERKK